MVLVILVWLVCLFFSWFLLLNPWGSQILRSCALQLADKLLQEMFLLKHGLVPCWNRMFLLSFLHFKLFCELKFLRTFSFQNISVRKHAACVLRGVQWLQQHQFQLAAAFGSQVLGSGHVSGCQTAQLPSNMGIPPRLCWLLMREGCGFIESLAQGNPRGFQAGVDYTGIQLALHVSQLSEQTWEQIDGLNWILLLMCQMDHLGSFLNLNVWLWSTTPLRQLNPIHLPPSSPQFSPEVVFFWSAPHPRGLPWQPRDDWQMLILLQLHFCQETAKSLKLYFMVFTVRPKVIKEHRAHLHKPTPFRAVILLSATSNSIFCTSLFTILRKPMKHSALPSHSSPSSAAAMLVMVYQETHMLPLLKRFMWSCQCGGTC